MFRKRPLVGHSLQQDQEHQQHAVADAAAVGSSSLMLACRSRMACISTVLVVAVIFYNRATFAPVPPPESKQPNSSSSSSSVRRTTDDGRQEGRTRKNTGGNPHSHSTSEKSQRQQQQLTRHKNSLIYLGTEATNTGWKVDTICLSNKSKDLIVYGVGAGEDISWDVGLVEKFNANVFIFDPTEKSLRYTAPIIEQYSKSHPNKLSHTAEGMSDHQGTLTFAMPANPDHVSMRKTDLATSDMMKKTVNIPVNTLQNWMSKNNHEYLDILKIDIEGSEYDVLESLLAADHLPFTQLLVEYHDRFLDDKSRHSKLISLLKQSGFVELWSDHGGQEAGYIKLADLQYCQDGKSTRHVTGQY
mmetsp:Transcript_61414/g.150312  ORF Transcript_61414/g.150312 Transcript_61414/m.150312 type:complete len:358 (-) Transcript_61414:2608-3681(-)